MNMKLSKILTELVGHYAYESGATDSGVHDTTRRQELKEEYLKSVNIKEEALWYRDYWLSDRAIEQGYGIEDVIGFANWIENELL